MGEGACHHLASTYRARAAEETAPHRITAKRLCATLEQIQHFGDGCGFPRFVESTFEEFLRCGVFAHGLVRVVCEDCRDETLVAFSCKRRGGCPSCEGRRMADTAAHLTDEVLPLREQERRDLVEIFDDRYGARSTIITSQLPTARWHEHVADPTQADAFCDRILHNAHNVVLQGESKREETAKGIH